MKKLLKWLGIIIGALIVLPVIIMVVSAIFVESDEIPAQKIELTQAQIDSIKSVEHENNIKQIENRIVYLKNYTWQANSLIAQYEENEIKADEMFKGKKVIINGRVENIGTDFTGSPYLIIGNYNYSSIQCVFPTSMKAKLVNVQKGQSYLIEGVCKGKVINILFDECDFTMTTNQLNKKLKELKAS